MPAFPQVVGQASFFSQAAAIGETSLFSVPADGVYQVDVYLATTTAAAGTDDVTMGLFWTDWNGAQEDEPVSVVLTAQVFQQASMVLMCRAGSAISFNTAFGGVSLGAAYSLRVIVVRLS